MSGKKTLQAPQIGTHPLTIRIICTIEKVTGGSHQIKVHYSRTQSKKEDRGGSKI